jgi:hypothetical protein
MVLGRGVALRNARYEWLPIKSHIWKPKAGPKHAAHPYDVRRSLTLGDLRASPAFQTAAINDAPQQEWICFASPIYHDVELLIILVSGHLGELCAPRGKRLVGHRSIRAVQH